MKKKSVKERNKKRKCQIHRKNNNKKIEIESKKMCEREQNLQFVESVREKEKIT